MIYSILRRNFISSFSKNLWFPEKCVAPFSLSVLYFSTSKEIKSVKNPAIYELLLQKHRLSPALASNVASVLPQSKTTEECDSILSFLKEIGFTKSHLEKALKILPRLLSCSLEKTVKPKIKIFQDMGFSGKLIADLLSREPKILHRSANETIIPRLILLLGLFGSNKEVAMVLTKAQWVLSTDLEKNMIPNIELLRSCGVSMKQIGTICIHAPKLFLNRPDVLRKYMDQAVELGVSRSSKVFVYAVAVIGSMTNGKWDQKLQAFRDILQCSEDDILRMVKRSPQVFTVSEDKIRRVKEIILGTGRYTNACIIEWPKSLMFSIEQRYRPRIEVLEILESKLLTKTWPSLQVLCRMSDDVFYKMFVSPHLDEVGEVYLARKSHNKKTPKSCINGIH